MPSSVDLTTLSDDLPVFLQSGIGVGYSAIDVRRALQGLMQEGVVDALDFKVSQRAAGAGMAVDVAAGNAYVQGDSIVGEGKYFVRRAAAFSGATEITADAAEANPRLDQVILEVKNDVHDGSGLNRGRVRYVKGTATAGATLDNRTGAAALPNTAMRLADVLMPAGAVNVPNANIRDRRPWARGAFRSLTRTSGNLSTTSTVDVDISAADFTIRVECSGAPIEVILSGLLEVPATGVEAVLSTAFDTSLVDEQFHSSKVAAAGAYRGGVLLRSPLLTPVAGTHLFTPRWRVVSGTATLYNSGVRLLNFTVREALIANANNTGA